MTFEVAGVGKQLLDNAYGLVNNMRDNANGYIAQANMVAAGTAPAGMTYQSIGATMQADAQLYLTRIGWMVTFAQNNPTTYQNALTQYGIAASEATGLKNTLQGVCNHTLAATLVDQASITAEANFQLSNVPTFGRLW